jgi:hypothetical protein
MSERVIEFYKSNVRITPGWLTLTDVLVIVAGLAP